MINFRKGILAIIVVFIVALMSTGCAFNQSFVENAYDSIATMNGTVNRVMTYAGEKYQEGEISDSQRDKITKLYEAYRNSANLATEALARYKETASEDAKEQYMEALRLMTENKEALKGLANLFIEEVNDEQSRSGTRHEYYGAYLDRGGSGRHSGDSAVYHYQRSDPGGHPGFEKSA